MTVIHTLTVDLVQPGIKPRLYAMQFDANTRTVAITLLSKAQPWEAPADAAFGLSYRKNDGTRGFYTQGITRNANTVSVTLAAQVLTCPGAVEAALVCTDSEGHRIAAFPFEIQVAADPAAGSVASENYFPQGNAVLYTPQALTAAQQLQAKANLGLAQATGWLYNGVELPDIRSVYTPALAAAYPYAVMIRNDLVGGGSYWLYLYDTEALAGSGGRLESVAGELHYLWTRFETGEAVNVYGPETGTGIAGVHSQVIWTNTDISNADGSLFLAASAPVPVYSETEEAGGAGTEVFRLSDYGISMSEVLMSGNVKTAQDCTDLVTAVTAALAAGKVPVLFDSMAGVYAVVTAVAPGYQIGGTLFGDMGDYIIKADVIIAVDAIYLYTQQLDKE